LNVRFIVGCSKPRCGWECFYITSYLTSVSSKYEVNMLNRSKAFGRELFWGIILWLIWIERNDLIINDNRWCKSPLQGSCERPSRLCQVRVEVYYLVDWQTPIQQKGTQTFGEGWQVWCPHYTICAMDGWKIMVLPTAHMW